MPDALSLDLRKRAVEAYERGEGSLREIAQRFDVSVASLCRWRAQVRDGEGLEAKPRSGGRTTQKIFDEHRAAMRRWLEEEPDLYQRELAARLLDEFGVKIDPSQLSRILREMNLPSKKNRRSTRGGSAQM